MTLVCSAAWATFWLEDGVSVGPSNLTIIGSISFNGDTRTSWPAGSTFDTWLTTNTYVKVEVDPVLTAWLGTNTYVKVESDPVFVAKSNEFYRTTNPAGYITAADGEHIRTNAISTNTVLPSLTVSNGGFFVISTNVNMVSAGVLSNLGDRACGGDLIPDPDGWWWLRSSGPGGPGTVVNYEWLSDPRVSRLPGGALVNGYILTLTYDGSCLPASANLDDPCGTLVWTTNGAAGFTWLATQLVNYGFTTLPTGFGTCPPPAELAPPTFNRLVIAGDLIVTNGVIQQGFGADAYTFAKVWARSEWARTNAISTNSVPLTKLTSPTPQAGYVVVDDGNGGFVLTPSAVVVSNYPVGQQIMVIGQDSGILTNATNITHGALTILQTNIGGVVLTQIKLSTNNSGGAGAVYYRGQINAATKAVEVLPSGSPLMQHSFSIVTAAVNGVLYSVNLGNFRGMVTGTSTSMPYSGYYDFLGRGSNETAITTKGKWFYEGNLNIGTNNDAALTQNDAMLRVGGIIESDWGGFRTPDNGVFATMPVTNAVATNTPAGTPTVVDGIIRIGTNDQTGAGGGISGVNVLTNGSAAVNTVSNLNYIGAGGIAVSSTQNGARADITINYTNAAAAGGGLSTNDVLGLAAAISTNVFPKFHVVEEFVSTSLASTTLGELGWVLFNGYSGTASKLSAEGVNTNHPGVLRLATGTTTGGGIHMELNTSSDVAPLAPIRTTGHLIPWWVKFTFRLNSIVSNITIIAAYDSLYDGTDFVGFLINSGGYTNWQFSMKNGGVTSTFQISTNSVPLDTNWHTIVIAVVNSNEVRGTFDSFSTNMTAAAIGQSMNNDSLAPYVAVSPGTNVSVATDIDRIEVYAPVSR